ncbi:unnamed protein product [Alternaria sp. RS040]
MTGTVLITGSNGSLALPAYSSFNLVLTVRDDFEEDVNSTKLRLLVEQHTDVQVSIRQLGLSSLENVRIFSKALLLEIESKKLPLIRTIICSAMTWNLAGGPQYFKDPELLVHPKADKEGEEMGRGFQRYAVSKLVPIMVMYELNRRLKTKRDTESIRAIAVDPLHLINSRAFHQSHVPRIIQIVTTVVTWMLPLLSYFDHRLKTVEQAAIPFVDVAVADKFAGQEGYFEGDKKVESSPDSLDINMQQALWRKSF